MRHKILSASLVVLWLALALSVSAQIPGFGTAPPPAAEQDQAVDPLGRSTPRGTIIAFTGAAHRDDFVSAARYMQLSGRRRQNAETLGRNLNELMDRYYHRAVSLISDSPDGDLNDGLALDREQVGPLEIGGEEVYVELVRVKDPSAGQIWLISSETLSQVPALHGSIEKTWIERVMPEVLLAHSVFGISMAQLTAWAASLGIPLLGLSLISLVFVALKRTIDDPARRRRFDSWYAGIRWPLILVLTLGIHLATSTLFVSSLRFRITYARSVAVLLVFALTWLIRRLLTLSFAYTRSRMRREQSATKSLMLLAERLLKALIIVVAVFVCLLIVGVDTTTSLAGLGIAGLALAVGAQKTVENFLGGFFLLSDRALAVGDTCSISKRVGVVEDITLRSVRLRTLEQTLLSIPAGALSQDSIENFSTRRKILVNTTLRLRYGTSSEQLKAILDGIRRLLAESPHFEDGTSRVRLVDFGVRAIELEIFAYALTSDYSEFLSIREQLLLRIAAIVESSGGSFASPERLELIAESARARETESYGRVP